MWPFTAGMCSRNIQRSAALSKANVCLWKLGWNIRMIKGEMSRHLSTAKRSLRGNLCFSCCPQSSQDRKLFSHLTLELEKEQEPWKKGRKNKKAINFLICSPVFVSCWCTAACVSPLQHWTQDSGDLSLGYSSTAQKGQTCLSFLSLCFCPLICSQLSPLHCLRCFFTIWFNLPDKQEIIWGGEPQKRTRSDMEEAKESSGAGTETWGDTETPFVTLLLCCHCCSCQEEPAPLLLPTSHPAQVSCCHSHRWHSQSWCCTPSCC